MLETKESLVGRLYPFMIREDGYNYIQDIPNGWLKNFGVEMLDDLKCAMGKNYNLFHCLDVKEKYGELVIYFDIWSDEVENVLTKYQKRSRQICLKCGEKVDRINKNLQIPICDFCLKKRRGNVSN